MTQHTLEYPLEEKAIMTRNELIATIIILGLVGTWAGVTLWANEQVTDRLVCFDQKIEKWGECKPPGALEKFVRWVNAGFQPP